MAEAQAASFLKYAAERRANSRHQSFFSGTDIKSCTALVKGSGGSSLAAPAPRAALEPRQGAGGATKKTSAAPSVMQELEIPKKFSKKVLQTMDVDTSLSGKTVLVRWQQLHDSIGPRKVPILAIEDVPSVIERQLELLGSVGPAQLFYHMRHHLPFDMEPGPDGNPRVIRGACGFTEESIELYMAGDPFYADVVRLCEDENDTQARPEKFLYVLMYVCLFTRRVWLRALRSKSAIGVAREIYFLWMDTMVPSKLQTDNGSEFANAILNELCDLFGVQFIHGSVGHPQSQGCSERANRLLRDTVRTNLMKAPTTCWPEQVMRVQDMINNRPCSVFSNNKTRNFVLFGTLPHTSKRPSVEEVNTVLQFESTAEAALPNAAAHRSAAAAAPRAGRSTGGKKRPAAAAAELPELSDEEDSEDAADDELEAAEWLAAVGTRHSRRQAAGSRLAAILAEEAAPLDGVHGEPPSRAMPQRAAAVGSSAGKRRRVTGILQAAAAQDAGAGPGSAAGAAEPGPSSAAAGAAGAGPSSAAGAAEPGPSSAAAGAAGAGPSSAPGAAADAAVASNEQVAVSMLEQLRREPVLARRSSRRQAAAAGMQVMEGPGSAEAEPAVLELLATSRAAAAAAGPCHPAVGGQGGVVEAGPSSAAAEVAGPGSAAAAEAGPSNAAEEEAGPSGAAADLELPVHLAEMRQQVLKDHEKNRARIKAQHRGKAKAREYNVGDVVLLTLPKCGTVGGDPVQVPKKPVAVVIGVSKAFGKRAYKVRTNAGVLSKAVEPRQLQPAPTRSAEMLRFSGVETTGVPTISVHAARGKAALKCRCRGAKCGPKCACKKRGTVCTRACGCKCGKGGNCGNCD